MKTRLELNKFDILINDIFVLNYYGTNVFFQVCGTNKDTVFVYELKTKRKVIDGIQVEMLCEKLTGTRTPYVVPREKNTYMQSNYEVLPTIIDGNVVLPIEIPFCSKLFLEASKKTECPVWGISYAVKVDEWYGTYWDCNEKKRSKNVFARNKQCLA